MSLRCGGVAPTCRRRSFLRNALTLAILPVQHGPRPGARGDAGEADDALHGEEEEERRPQVVEREGARAALATAIDAKTLDSFFDTTTYVGAVKDANDTWFAGWTCNSAYAPFDSTSTARRACTSIPL